jgi:hypothetical protein
MEYLLHVRSSPSSFLLVIVEAMVPFVVYSIVFKPRSSVAEIMRRGRT